MYTSILWFSNNWKACQKKFSVVSWKYWKWHEFINMHYVKDISLKQVETTRFCDVGIHLHTKLAICLLLSADQSVEWVARHCGLLRVLLYTIRIENIYYFELSFGNSFSIIFQNLWNKYGILCLIFHFYAHILKILLSRPYINLFTYPNCQCSKERYMSYWIRSSEYVFYVIPLVWDYINLVHVEFALKFSSVTIMRML